MTSPPIQCACCDHFSLADGDWEICPVCLWEADGLGIGEPDEVSGPNHRTLRQARANFASFGACDRNVPPKVLTVQERGRYAVKPRAVGVGDLSVRCGRIQSSAPGQATEDVQRAVATHSGTS